MPYRFKTTPTRSRNMRAIRSVNNATTERKLRAHLVQSSITGWRVRSSDLPGNPDFVFPTAKVAVFTDGCFWHGCPRCGHTPKSNPGYWKEKLRRNKSRDRAVNRKLQALGFKVVRFWECEVRRNPRKCLGLLLRALGKNRASAKAHISK